MDRIETIKKEDSTDPLGRGYSGMTNQQFLDSLSAVDRPQHVPEREVMVYIMRDLNKWGTIQKISNNSVHVLYEVCKTVTDLLLHDQKGDLDMRSTSVQGIMDALVSGGVLTSEEKTQLEGLQDNRISRAQELGLGKTDIGEITEARL